MKRWLRRFAGLVLTIAALAWVLAGDPATRGTSASAPRLQPSSSAMSDRVVEYQIDARYDNRTKSLQATETLVYHNKTGQSLDRFPFHLYLNAFQPESTWMKEGRRDRSVDEWESSMRGSIEISSLSADGFGDLTSKMRFISPDDGNPNDKTVMEVVLPRPVAAGESIKFRLAFRSKFPEVVARTGYKGDFIMGAQWFPKIAVWWKGAWNAHQFHEATEFFSDFGVYDVNLTVPDTLVVGATGVETANRKNSDGTKTLSFHAADVHDFAWAADPSFVVTTSQYAGAHNTTIRLLMLPDHVPQTSRHMRAAQETLRLFEQWFGPYPYEQLTIVDPANFAAGGMEYPTLITAGTFWRMPEKVHVPESVVVHEVGHQYWYAMVANNEFEEPWLDEGINSYTEIKVMESMFDRNEAFSGWLGPQLSARGDYWRSYVGKRAVDALGSNAVKKLNASSILSDAYNKPALMLLTLEDVIGEKGVLNGLRIYFERNRFRHPTGRDLMDAMEESSGKDLDWFFDQAIAGTQKLDYSVTVKALEDVSGREDLSRSEVVIHREGEFVYPVTLQVTFADGTKLRENWDGRERWKRFTFEKKSPVLSAEIDPEHKVWLDQSRLNDSYLVKPDGRATRKLAAYWIVAVQFLQQAMGWLS